MCPFNRFTFVRLFFVCLLALVSVGVVSAASGPVMVSYSDIPIYGRSSGMDATIDVYLPEIALDETQREFGITLQDDLPTVLFVPALNDALMQDYAQTLTDRGYGVIAVDYRPEHAVPDSMCALAWAHQVGSTYHLDPNHIAAVGAGAGGRIAALMGSADLGWRPTYEGGVVRLDTPAPYPMHGLDRCPYPMPEAPMIEAVAAYDAELGTPVALLDPAFQTAEIPPIGTTRAQMVALFNEFAAIPADEWRTAGTVPEPSGSPATLNDQTDAPTLWTITPPEIAAEFQTSLNQLGQLNPAWQADAAGENLWAIAPPEIAAAHQTSEGQTNPDWQTDVAISLPVYWLNGNEPPHLLMVGSDSNLFVQADNAVYTELLRDNGVPVQLIEVNGCSSDPCMLTGDTDPLKLFLTDVMYGS